MGRASDAHRQIGMAGYGVPCLWAVGIDIQHYSNRFSLRWSRIGTITLWSEIGPLMSAYHHIFFEIKTYLKEKLKVSKVDMHTHSMIINVVCSFWCEIVRSSSVVENFNETELETVRAVPYTRCFTNHDLPCMVTCY